MFTVFFTSTPVTDYRSALTSDRSLYARFFNALLSRGVYFPPSQFEAAFVSIAHSERDIAATIRAARAAFKELLPNGVNLRHLSSAAKH